MQYMLDGNGNITLFSPVGDCIMVQKEHPVYSRILGALESDVDFSRIESLMNRDYLCVSNGKYSIEHYGNSFIINSVLDNQSKKLPLAFEKLLERLYKNADSMYSMLISNVIGYMFNNVPSDSDDWQPVTTIFDANHKFIIPDRIMRGVDDNTINSVKFYLRHRTSIHGFSEAEIVRANNDDIYGGIKDAVIKACVINRTLEVDKFIEIYLFTANFFKKDITEFKPCDNNIKLASNIMLQNKYVTEFTSKFNITLSEYEASLVKQHIDSPSDIYAVLLRKEGN